MSRTDTRLLAARPYPARPTLSRRDPPTLDGYIGEVKGLGDRLAAELTKAIEAIDSRRSVGECDRALRAVRLTLGTLACDLADVRYRAAMSKRLFGPAGE